MAVNLGYGTVNADDKNNPTALRLDELVVRDGRIMRDTTPGVLQ